MKKLLLITILLSSMLEAKSLTETRLENAVKIIKKTYNIQMKNKICVSDTYCSIDVKGEAGTTINFRHMIIDVLPNPYGNKEEYKKISSAVLMSLIGAPKKIAEQMIDTRLTDTQSGAYKVKNTEINVKIQSNGRIEFQFIKANFN